MNIRISKKNKLNIILNNIIFFNLIVFLELILFLYFSIFMQFNHDEFEAIHTAWKITNGEKIYIDFFQHHHDLFYYLLSPIIILFKDNVFTIYASRIFVFLLFLLILYYTYKIADTAFNKQTGIISVILLCTLSFFQKAIEVRPDVPQVAFALISIYFYLKFLDKNKNIKYLLLSSFTLSLSFLFLQKTIFLFFAFLIVQIYELIKKIIRFKNFIIFWGISILICAIYIIAMNYYSLDIYYKLNWLLNIKNIRHFSAIIYLIETLNSNKTLWCFYIIGAIFFIYGHKQRQILILSILLFLSLFIVRTPFKQYYLLFLPLIAIISANALSQIFNKNNKPILLCFIIVLSLFSSYSMYRNTGKNKEQIKLINYVLSITDKNDFVYDGNIDFNVFRKDIDYFWYSIDTVSVGLGTYLNYYKYHFNIYEKILKYKPKIISTYYLSVNDKRIKNLYKKDDYYNIYIRN